MPQPSVHELMKMTDEDKPTWDLYANGHTLGLNQVEKSATTDRVMHYKPKNMSELCAFVAAIRPAFKSMINVFLDRQHFDYGIPALDKLLQTREIPSSFILYQEQMMKVLQYAGFEASASYAAIKAIAKKHPEKVKPLREQFLVGFSKKLIADDGVSQDTAQETSENVWQVISDACGYGYNASHSASVCLDSMYTAWAKAHYPYETYAALMTNYAKKGDKDRIDRARVEMKRAFGISIAPCRYRQDNRTFFIDKERHTISDTLMSVKCISYRVAQALYEMRDNQYESFTDLLIDMQTRPEFDTRVTEILIRMGYFEEFGHAGKLLCIFRMFNSGSLMYKKTHSAKTKATRREKLIALERESKETDIFFVDQLAFEAEYFGTPLSVYKERRWEAVVLDVDERYSIKVQLYNASKGTVGVMRIKKALYANCPLQKGDVIRVNDFRKTPARRYLNGKSVIDPDRYENWITSYQILPPQDPMTKKKE